MSGVGITYLWPKKKFPPFIRLEGKRGDYEVYTPERTCHIVKASRKYVLSDGTELFENGCSVCNCYLGVDDNYCPNCGAKVVEQ